MTPSCWSRLFNLPSSLSSGGSTFIPKKVSYEITVYVWNKKSGTLFLTFIFNLMNMRVIENNLYLLCQYYKFTNKTFCNLWILNIFLPNISWQILLHRSTAFSAMYLCDLYRLVAEFTQFLNTVKIILSVKRPILLVEIPLSIIKQELSLTISPLQFYRRHNWDFGIEIGTSELIINFREDSVGKR